MKKIVSAACLAAVVTATPALAAEKGTTWLEAWTLKIMPENRYL